jgi:hypothetical protein
MEVAMEPGRPTDSDGVRPTPPRALEALPPPPPSRPAPAVHTTVAITVDVARIVRALALLVLALVYGPDVVALLPP